MLVDAPIFTPNACEGTTTLFETDYFDEKAYLTQSGQLYMEAAAMAFGKVYCFGPTFRAEKSKTRRHLIEFWMLEPEMAFATLDDVMALEEDMLEHVVGRVLEERGRGARSGSSATRRTLAAREEARSRACTTTRRSSCSPRKRPAPSSGAATSARPTRRCSPSRSTGRSSCTTSRPRSRRSTWSATRRRRATACRSTAWPPRATARSSAAASARPTSATSRPQIEEHGLPEEAFEWYLDLRRYGSVPHAGFGIGVERTLAWICGLEHVRESIPFPRLLNRLEP